MAFDVLSFVMGQQTAKSGGGSGDYSDVHFVTFMSEDGSTELYKRPVADGDDCADPVIRGLISEPTKESTAQYNYTHVGWSDSPNGALNSNILKTITADKTVYANFAAVLRYYTVTYYDSDGTTVLKTESLAYGTTPSYTPTKDDYNFVAWTPNVPVTGEMSYIATWKEKPKFETTSWEEIAEICNAGNAATAFSIGDTKPVTLTYSDGTSETINFRIIDMGADTAEDGTITGITMMADNLVKTSTSLISGVSGSKDDIYKCDIFSSFMTDLESAFPTDLMSVVKTVKKNGSIVFNTKKKIFIPSYRQLTGTQGSATTGTNPGEYSEYNVLPQAQYSWFKSGNSKNRKKLNSSADDIYWTSTPYYRKGDYTAAVFVYIDPSKTLIQNSAGGNGTAYGVCPCFCI